MTVSGELGSSIQRFQDALKKVSEMLQWGFKVYQDVQLEGGFKRVSELFRAVSGGFRGFRIAPETPCKVMKTLKSSGTLIELLINL